MFSLGVTSLLISLLRSACRPQAKRQKLSKIPVWWPWLTIRYAMLVMSALDSLIVTRIYIDRTSTKWESNLFAQTKRTKKTVFNNNNNNNYDLFLISWNDVCIVLHCIIKLIRDILGAARVGRKMHRAT